jgi:hypothetical protein
MAQGQIFESSLDGTQMRKLVEAPRQSMMDAPTGMRWTPDSKRISFVYKGALWTVPAD